MIAGVQLSANPSIKSCHHISFRGFQLISWKVRWKTIHFLTLSHSVKASSAISFNGTVLLPLNAPSEVMSKAQEASLILAARAEEEKPAKTTECTAPIRAQARTAMVSSGTMGI